MLLVLVFCFGLMFSLICFERFVSSFRSSVDEPIGPYALRKGVRSKKEHETYTQALETAATADLDIGSDVDYVVSDESESEEREDNDHRGKEVCEKKKRVKREKGKRYGKNINYRGKVYPVMTFFDVCCCLF